MSENINSQDSFNYSFRAACKSCGKYVGSKRNSEPEADADGQAHKAISGNEDHKVITEETQST